VPLIFGVRPNWSCAEPAWNPTAALLEVADERGEGLVEVRHLVRDAVLDIIVMVPAA